jgi:cytochrome c-type biogenesis protein CcmH/NrfF
LLATAPPAKDGRPEQILSELSNDLMSPYCPGRTIASCPSEQARKLEDHILAEAQAGKSRTEIEQDLVATFGQEIVGYAPQPMLLYGVAAAGIAGLMLVAWVGRKWMRARAPLTAAAAGVPAGTAAAAAGSSPKTRGPSAAERERLEDALDDLDEF